MSAQTQLLQRASVLSGRQMVMLLIIALHALFISGLMAMRMTTTAVNHDTRTTLEFVPPTLRPSPPEPQLKPHLLPPTVDVPQPDPIPTIPQPQTPLIPSGALPVPTPVAQNGTGTVAEIASTPLQYRAVRDADDYYPSTSLSLQEQGTSIVQVCVAPSGKLDGKPVIEQSSGSSRLDAAALQWAREALRFTPATQNGVAVSACKGFRVNFTLH